jgi:ribosomal protein S19
MISNAFATSASLNPQQASIIRQTPDQSSLLQEENECNAIRDKDATRRTCEHDVWLQRFVGCSRAIIQNYKPANSFVSITIRESSITKTASMFAVTRAHSLL